MAICYDASGNPESSSDLPCSQDGSPAQCCWITDGCADNGLCVTNDSATDLTPYFINGCTDPNWADGSVSTCLTACLNSTGNGVQPCGGNKYCCFGTEGCDCNDSSQLFTLPALGIVKHPETVQSSSSGTTSSSIETSTMLTTSVATSSTFGTTTSAFPNSPTSPSASSYTGSNNNNLRIGLGVGLGVGIPLIAAVIALVWFFGKRHAGQRQQDYYGQTTGHYNKPWTDSNKLYSQSRPPPIHELPHPSTEPQELYARDGTEHPDFSR